MKHLLFIRHAQTEMSGRYCGHANPPVNQAGHLQIEHLVHALENETIDAVVSSDLQRAVTTAQALARPHNLSVILRPTLREIHFGEWEGLRWDEIEQRDPVYAQQWVDNYPHLPAPHGEPFDQFQQRVLDEVSHIANLAAATQVAVITHAGVMRVLLQSHCGISEREAFDATRNYCSSFKYALRQPHNVQLSYNNKQRRRVPGTNMPMVNDVLGGTR